MKVFLSLISFCLMLATCRGACFADLFKVEFIDGKPVLPTTCLDVNDGTKHLIGSTWDTDNCLRCGCGKDGMKCCDRNGGIQVVEGCTTVRNPVTCKHEHYRIDDPSQRCDV